MIKRKVLIVITTDFVPYGGLTTVMMNYYRAMNKENLQIDFASTNDPCDELKRELAQNDSKYFDLVQRERTAQENNRLLHLRKARSTSSKVRISTRAVPACNLYQGGVQCKTF